MADKGRKLTYGEQRGSVFSSEKGRDRADARRQIEGLNLAEQQTQAAQRANGLVGEQTMYLKYMAERLQGIETLLGRLVEQGEAAARRAGAQPPPPPQH